MRCIVPRPRIRSYLGKDLSFGKSFSRCQAAGDGRRPAVQPKLARCIQNALHAALVCAVLLAHYALRIRTSRMSSFSRFERRVLNASLINISFIYNAMRFNPEARFIGTNRATQQAYYYEKLKRCFTHNDTHLSRLTFVSSNYLFYTNNHHLSSYILPPTFFIIFFSLGIQTFVTYKICILF